MWRFLALALCVVTFGVLSCGPTTTEDAGVGGGTGGGGGKRDSGAGGGGAMDDGGCTMDEQCRIDGGQDVCCYGDCFDLRTTPMHCGMCFDTCSANHATPSCAASSCNSMCLPGYADCDMNLRSNGCETNIATNPLTCGACGAACSTNNITPACDGGQCSGTCRAGFADCNNDLRADGCERSVAGDVMNCGACNRTCSATNVAMRGCDAGACVGTCATGFGNCNDDLATDGCEVDTRTTLQHCGACNRACSTQNITPTCAAGACTGACATGFADGNGNKQTDGCEIDTRTSPDQCGGCTGSSCSSNHISVRACTNGTCTGACDPGFHDCDANKRTNGCETTASNTNCRSCGDVCGPAGQKTCMTARCIGYTASTPAVAWIDACSLTGMQRYLTNQFDATQTQTIPFAFSFYGQPVASYFVSTNGYLGFGPSDATSNFFCIPNASNPSGGGIFAFADDLRTFAGGVCIGTTGTTPNQKHVITWSGAQRDAATGTVLTFSVILNETSNVIQVVYNTMTGDPTATGNQAAIGVQNANGTLGTSFGCNQAVANPGTAVTFTP